VLKWLETLKGYNVTPETTEPEFEKVPSRSLLIMARLGEWNVSVTPSTVLT